MTATHVGFVFLATSALSLAMFLPVRHARGVIRVRLYSLLLLSAVFSGGVGAVLVIAGLGWDRSESLGLLGLVVTIVPAFLAGRRFESLRTLRVALVIPSEKPFHRELRAGLRNYLGNGRFVISDAFMVDSHPTEDLSGFLRVLHHAMQLRPDVLVVCSPAIDLANNASTVEILRRHTRRGGHVVFIESVPETDLQLLLGDCTSIQTDTRMSAKLVSLITNELLARAPELKAEVLLLPGPSHSRPGAGRRDALLALLEPDHSVTVVQPLTWSREEARASTERHLAAHPLPSIVIAGNDEMALGVSDALRAADCNHPPPVVGHDGIAQVLFAISDPWSPLAATISVPPALIGEYAGADIVALRARWMLLLPSVWRRLPQPELILVPLTSASIVTTYNVRDRLD